MVSLKMAQDDYNEQEMELLRDKRKLKTQQKEQGLAHQDEIQTICMVRGADHFIYSQINLLTFQVMIGNERGGGQSLLLVVYPGAGLLSADRRTYALPVLIVTQGRNALWVNCFTSCFTYTVCKVLGMKTLNI
jgi:hypothetical protein